jgi:hypothetical protein
VHYDDRAAYACACACVCVWCVNNVFECVICDAECCCCAAGTVPSWCVQYFKRVV